MSTTCTGTRHFEKILWIAQKTAICGRMCLACKRFVQNFPKLSKKCVFILVIQRYKHTIIVDHLQDKGILKQNEEKKFWCSYIPSQNRSLQNSCFSMCHFHGLFVTNLWFLQIWANFEILYRNEFLIFFDETEIWYIWNIDLELSQFTNP